MNYIFILKLHYRFRRIVMSNSKTGIRVQVHNILAVVDLSKDVQAFCVKLCIQWVFSKKKIYFLIYIVNLINLTHIRVREIV